jgi:hypothetical protein
MLTVMTACYHEAGHSVVALRFGLPLARVIVRDDGTGRTSYRHWLGAAEIERWIVTTYAGGEAEADRFPGHPADASDRRSIDAALKALDLVWDQRRLGELRADARTLVRAERRSIQWVANELLRLRTLSADEIRRLVG